MDSKQDLSVEFIMTDNNAYLPTKAHSSDVGFDLCAISVYKKLSDRTTLFDTGIAVKPPKGYYTEILPRSSLSKTGYMLSNSVGIIDPDYRGSLLIALTKIDDSLPDIQLPFIKCQLVLRKMETFSLVQVKSLNETDRGDGGFGSTDDGLK